MTLTLYIAHVLVFNFVVDWMGWVEPPGSTSRSVRAGVLGRRHRRRDLVEPPLRPGTRRTRLPRDRRLVRRLRRVPRTWCSCWGRRSRSRGWNHCRAAPTNRGSSSRGRHGPGSAAGSGRRRPPRRLERLLDLARSSNWSRRLASRPTTPARQSAWSSSATEYSLASRGSCCWSRCISALMPSTFWMWWPYSWATMYCAARSPGRRTAAAAGEEVEVEVHEVVGRAVERPGLRRRLTAPGVREPGEEHGLRDCVLAAERRGNSSIQYSWTSIVAPHRICSASLLHGSSSPPVVSPSRRLLAAAEPGRRAVAPPSSFGRNSVARQEHTPIRPPPAFMPPPIAAAAPARAPRRARRRGRRPRRPRRRARPRRDDPGSSASRVTGSSSSGAV